MKTILVASDFSIASLNAANYAAEMALVIDADILLLHIYQIPVAYLQVPVAATENEMMYDAKKSMVHLREKLIQKTGGKLNIKTEIGAGVFFHELKSVCEKIKPYAVVMGSQGTTAAERIFFGGHTAYAMKHLMWPLITVPPTAKFSLIKKIGLACDFDKVVDSTPLNEIKMLINDFHAELHVINTGKREEHKPEIIFESALLEEMLGPLKPQYHFITTGNIDDGIIEFAEKNHIDLLVTLPKRHRLLSKLAHKSHSKQLVLHSHVPVLSFHPSA